MSTDDLGEMRVFTLRRLKAAADLLLSERQVLKPGLAVDLEGYSSDLETVIKAVDRHPTTSNDPIYFQVADFARDQIKAGKLGPGAPIPLQFFCDEFDCQRQTAAKGLKIMIEEGLMALYPGIGYFVKKRSG